MASPHSWRDTFADSDRDEADRASALISFVSAGDVAGAIDSDAADALVNVLNEPLCLLPRLAWEHLAAHGVFVGANTTQQRLVYCPHSADALVDDDRSTVTGQSRCMDCDRTVVPVARIAALAGDLEFGCGFFSGPPPRRGQGMLIDSSFHDRPEVRVGSGATDDVINVAVPAGGVVVRSSDTGATVDVGAHLGAFVRAPLWLLADEPLSARIERSLARPRCALPAVADLAVYRLTDPDSKPAVVTINRAVEATLMIRWEGFGTQRLIRQGESAVLSFDRRISVVRTPSEVIVLQREHERPVISLPFDGVTALAIGDASAVWDGRGLTLRGCPPPRARSINLRLFDGAPPRRR
jgi:hypothetical protein